MLRLIRILRLFPIITEISDLKRFSRFLNLPQFQLLISSAALIRENAMSRICKITGKKPISGSTIERSGKAKKEGGIGRHVKSVVKRKFYPNLQRVKVIDEKGTVKYIRVAASAIKKGLITKAPKRRWKPEEAEAK